MSPEIFEVVLQALYSNPCGTLKNLRLRRATRRNVKRLAVRRAQARRFFRERAELNVGRRK